MTVYEYTDIAIRDMNRRYLRWFNRLKLLPFDELNVMRGVNTIISEVSSVYSKCVDLAKIRYLQIAVESYIAAYAVAVSEKKERPGISKESVQAPAYINEDWILDMLEEYDPVTLYRFIPETERKKQRLIEALVATSKPNEEVDKALRYWVLQSSQYADNVTDKATLSAYKDAGVTMVRWVTERDEKVCNACDEKDGNVYPIDKAPPSEHIHCRCYYVPA